MFEDYVVYYVEMFCLFVNKVDCLLFFYCIVGKDRMGLGVYLIFYVLGVDEGLIFEDYFFIN